MSSSSFQAIKGRDALLEYVPNTSYPVKRYVEKDFTIYKSNTQTSTIFVSSEWSPITTNPNDINLETVTNGGCITTNSILINGGTLSADKKIAIYTDDCQFSCVDLIGNNTAGGGVFYVGGNYLNGGGIAHQNNDYRTCGYEHYKTSIFRRYNGTNIPVMTFGTTSSDVNFSGFIYEQGQLLSERYLSASDTASDSEKLSGLTSNQFLRSDLTTVCLGSITDIGKTLNIISNDTTIATLSLYGETQGTGSVFVGRNSLYGGGVAYHGDNTPIKNYCTNATSFYRKNNGIDATVFYYGYDCNNVVFNGSVCAPLFFEGGSALTNKYLGVNGVAKNTCLFSGLTHTQFIRSDVDSLLNNNVSTQWGSGVELRYCGVNNNSYIINNDSTGSLYISYDYLGSTLNSIIAKPNDCVSLYYNNNEKLYTMVSGITVNGCGFATEWIETSDVALKECMTSIENPLEKTVNLCGLYYNRKGETGRQIGLIAQDVEKIIPEAVSEFPSTDAIKELTGLDMIKGINYNNLTPLLIEAIKELKIEIDILKNN